MRVSCTNCTPHSRQRYLCVPLKLPFFLVRYEPHAPHFFCVHTLELKLTLLYSDDTAQTASLMSIKPGFSHREYARLNLSRSCGAARTRTSPASRSRVLARYRCGLHQSKKTARRAEMLLWSQIIPLPSQRNFCDPASRSRVLARYRCGLHQSKKTARRCCFLALVHPVRLELTTFPV